jgi:hypothetical protein
VPPSPDFSLTAPLKRIKELADDLARIHEGDPARHTMADSIKHDVDAVLRALRRPKRRESV